MDIPLADDQINEMVYGKSGQSSAPRTTFSQAPSTQTVGGATSQMRQAPQQQRPYEQRPAYQQPSQSNALQQRGYYAADDALTDVMRSESFDRAIQEAADFQASHAAPRAQPPQYTRAAQPPQQQAQWQTARPAHDWADHGPECAWFLY